MEQAQVTAKSEIEERPIQTLRSHPRNPRTHSKKQIRQIAESIRKFGFLNPVLVDADGNILAGHGRVEAAKLLGMERVRTVRVEGMTKAQKRAYVLADNKLAELAGWDYELVRIELEHIKELDLNFDLTLTGFDTPELDLLLEGEDNQESGATEPEGVPEPDNSGPPVTVLGDFWRLGTHRLLCGDARDSVSYRRLLEGSRAQMVFADPPYNVPIDGHVCGLGAVKHDDFAMASGEMTGEEFIAFLSRVLRNLTRHTVDGSIHFICMDWRHIHELSVAGRAAYTELKNLCIWNKSNAGMGTFYRSKHELVFVYKNGTSAHVNNFQLGQHGRYRTNVWDYAGVNTLREGRLEELQMHPTVKPVALVADAIKDCSKRGGLVLDPFAGSGTTIVAAEQTGRRAHAIELDPRYVDVAVRRWESLTGERATHAESNFSFEDMKERRGNNNQKECH